MQNGEVPLGRGNRASLPRTLVKQFWVGVARIQQSLQFEH